jgi:hypothetical protein
MAYISESCDLLMAYLRSKFPFLEKLMDYISKLCDSPKTRNVVLLMAYKHKSHDFPKKEILMAYISELCGFFQIGISKKGSLMAYVSKSCDLSN